MRLKIFLLTISDILIFYFALIVALYIRYGIIERELTTLTSSLNLHFFSFTIIFAVWLIVFWAAGLYDLARLKNEQVFYKTFFSAFLINAVTAVLFFYFIPYFIITPKINLFIDLILTIVLLFFWRQYFNKLAGRVFKINVVFLGASPEVLELKEIFINNPQLGYQTAGILAPDNVSELETLWRTEKFSIIVTAEKFDHSQKLTILLLEYLKKGIIINDLDKFYEGITFRVPISIIREAWFFENIVETERGIYELLKRTFDIVLSLALGVITVIVFPFVFSGLKIFDPGPIFYKQKRIGKNGKNFTLIKFRSLPIAQNIDEKMRKPNDKETTAFGKFIRKTHVDELPQIWNILKGEMSFIGPRPEKPEFVKRFSDEIPFYEMRQLIKPGLAGWAQLNNPNAGPSPKETMEKLQYDLYYIKNRSVFLDLSIIFKTAKIMFSAVGK